ncbi:MAG: sulfite exporter TauE/SafE family protein [Endomicrobia bacterium]|nr:sulfite exporter TauE/SafE family protein [Endomicrobiia bacterium]
MQHILYILVGLFSGVISGVLGLGGGTIIIPVLVYLFGFTQHQAQGTSLILVSLPVGVLALINYYKHGNLPIKPGLIIAVGFLLGGYIGSWVAHQIPSAVLKKIFGIFLFFIALKMVLGR